MSARGISTALLTYIVTALKVRFEILHCQEDFLEVVQHYNLCSCSSSSSSSSSSSWRLTSMFFQDNEGYGIRMTAPQQHKVDDQPLTFSLKGIVYPWEYWCIVHIWNREYKNIIYLFILFYFYVITKNTHTRKKNLIAWLIRACDSSVRIFRTVDIMASCLNK